MRSRPRGALSRRRRSRLSDALTSRRGVDARGNRARDRPRADRVPADLQHRSSAHRPRLHGWEDPGRGVHGRHPARDDGRGAPLLPRRPDPDRAGVAALAARPLGAARARRAHRLVHRARHDPDRDLRGAVQGPDRERGARPLPDRGRADRARPGAAGRGEGGHARRARSSRSRRRTAWPWASPRRWR